MDTIKDYAGNDIQVYVNQIDQELIDFYLQFIPEKQHGDMLAIEQYITESSQSRWNAALMHIGKTLFNDKKSLKVAPYMQSGNSTIKTNNNKYNYELLNLIADYLIYISNRYEKVVNFNSFGYLTNIDKDTISQWNNTEKYNVSSEGIDIYKKLYAANEDTLSAMLETGKRQPVSILSVLNHRHSWNLPGVTREISTGKRAISAEDIKNIGIMHNSSAALEDSQNA